MDPSTRFDDAEIRRILARAADRQEQADRALPAASAGSRSGTEPGLSLAELQEVAGEAGIDAAHVVAAAREVQLSTAVAPERYRFVGIPMELVERRIVPGHLADREWERIVGEFRSAFRTPGTTNSFGDVREWFSSGAGTTGAPVRLRLDPGEDGIEVSLRQSTKSARDVPLALGWTFGSMGAVFGLIVAVGSLDPGAAALPALFGVLSGGSFLGGRWAARRWARRQSARFSRLLDRVELIARGGGTP
jgi:hypothetical protein